MNMNCTLLAESVLGTESNISSNSRKCKFCKLQYFRMSSIFHEGRWLQRENAPCFYFYWNSHLTKGATGVFSFCLNLRFYTEKNLGCWNPNRGSGFRNSISSWSGIPHKYRVSWYRVPYFEFRNPGNRLGFRQSSLLLWL